MGVSASGRNNFAIAGGRDSADCCAQSEKKLLHTTNTAFESPIPRLHVEFPQSPTERPLFLTAIFDQPNYLPFLTIMRPLTESETQTLFTKLANYTGSSLKNLIQPLDDSPNADRYVFRLHQSRCYYVRLSIANMATSVSRHQLLSLGTCLGMPPKPASLGPEHTKLTLNTGKFTKTGKFRLHITALPILAEHARYKVWVKSNGEMPFLYGGNVVKAHVGRWSEDCPEHQGVVVYSMNDTPLGFGVTARSTQEARRLDPTAITCFRQADCGEYLREEDTLFTTT